MAEKSEPKTTQRSWSRKIPTDGGPVSYLAIYDGQAEIRIPEEVPMGQRGTYHYEYSGTYHWIPHGT